MRQFIVGTDWLTDCDDAVAMRILARAHKAGEICIKGIVMNACMEYSIASLDGFLNLEGVEDIPLAIDLEGNDFGGRTPYQHRLAPFAKKYKCNKDAENAVRLYRRILAESKDPVEIIEVGYMQAIVAAINSTPDDISPQSGIELFKDKVSKIWIMAGKWDADGEKENNFARNQRSIKAGHELCKVCPVPITFLGWEVGITVISGSKLNKDDYLHQALVDHGSGNGRCSWDPMLAVLALINDESKAGYDTVCGTASVDAETGANYFKPCEFGMHKYVVKKYPDSYYANYIDDAIKSI